jgi:hypothetical protein
VLLWFFFCPGSSEQACELIAEVARFALTLDQIKCFLDGPEQMVRSKKPANTQSVSAEKLPVARLLPCLSSELKDVALHERDPELFHRSVAMSPSRWPE